MWWQIVVGYLIASRLVEAIGTRGALGRTLGGQSTPPPKWFLYFCMDLLAILSRWYTGGTYSWVAPFDLIVTLSYFGISLSNTCFLVRNPAIFIHIIIFSYILNIWDSVLLRIGLEKMKFALVSYAIIIYLIPLLDRYGNLTVWSEYIVSFRSTTLMNN